jgi:hypothetical protein
MSYWHWASVCSIFVFVWVSNLLIDARSISRSFCIPASDLVRRLCSSDSCCVETSVVILVELVIVLSVVLLEDKSWCSFVRWELC